MLRRTTVTGMTVALVVLTLALAAPAYACNPSAIQLFPTNPGPGDTVRYTITNLTAGSEFRFSIAGLGISGTASAGGVGTGSFTMPDLGDASVGVGVTDGIVQHESGDGDPGEASLFGQAITYTSPAPPPAAPSDAPAQHAPASHPSAPTTPAPPAVGGDTPAARHLHGPRGGGSGTIQRSRRAARSHVSPTAAERPVQDAGATAAAPVTVATPPTATHAARSASKGRNARKVHRAEPAVRPPLRPSALPTGPALERKATVTRGELTSGALPAVGIFLVVGLAGAWWARVRRARDEPLPEPPAAEPVSPDSPGDTIDVEAELQELIAEERARRMVPQAPMSIDSFD